MRFILKYFPFILLIILAINSFAQNNTDIIKSKEKIIIEGKKYYLHEVKKGETIYAICKAYNVTQKDIALENPDVFQGLKIGIKIKIPMVSTSGGAESDFFYHTIEKGQTLSLIAKKYEIDIADIQKSNPKLPKLLQLGEVIKIPKSKISIEKYSTKKNTLPVKDTILPDQILEYELYTIKAKETLYAIAKNHNTTIDALYLLNPNTKNKELQIGQQLKVPKINNSKVVETKKSIKTSNITLEKTTLTATTLIKPSFQTPDSLKKDTVNVLEILNPKIEVKCDEFDYTTFNKPFNIALFLPLFGENNIGLDVEKAIKNEAKIYPNTNFLDYYEGTLMAIDSLRRAGVKINLSVYDTQKDPVKTKAFLNKPDLINTDLIIGPVYNNLLDIVDDFAKKNQIPLVSPLASRNANLNSNPYLFQVTASFATQLDQTIKQLIPYSKNNFIIVHGGSKEELNQLQSIKEKLFASLSVNTTPEKILYKEVDFKKKGITAIDSALSESIDNVILLTSQDRVLISDLVRLLNTGDLLTQNNVILLAFPSIRKFDNIELNDLHALQMHTFMATFPDYNNDFVKHFVRSYRHLYNTEPSPFSMQGYDVAFYFINALKTYGKNFAPCLSNYKPQLTQSEFNFVKADQNSGYENTTTYIIEYTRDLDVIKADFVSHPVPKEEKN